MKSRFLFLYGWVEGSDSADGEDTAIHASADLYPELLKKNDAVQSIEIEIEHNGVDKYALKQIAVNYGRSEAWDNNYTAHDSVSILLPEGEYHLDDEEGESIITPELMTLDLT